MSRKRARFDVVSIEISVHCPHCDVLSLPPAFQDVRFTWNADDIRRALGRDIQCATCHKKFQLPNNLRNLLAPSSEPVASDRRVSKVYQVQIICATCSGDAPEPKYTLLATDGRCASCGGENFVIAHPYQPDAINSNGKEQSENASHPNPNTTATNAG